MMLHHLTGFQIRKPSPNGVFKRRFSSVNKPYSTDDERESAVNKRLFSCSPVVANGVFGTNLPLSADRQPDLTEKRNPAIARLFLAINPS
jgi:hypothetical protein